MTDQELPELPALPEWVCIEVGPEHVAGIQAYARAAVSAARAPLLAEIERLRAERDAVFEHLCIIGVALMDGVPAASPKEKT